jgi:hypothetical protein
MKAARWLAPILALALVQATASAGILFSAVTISPTPAAGALTEGATGLDVGDSINFNLPNAVVGDGYPVVAGVFSLTYEAISDVPLTENLLHLATLGNLTLSGTGRIIFNEVIESLDGIPAVIATYGTTITAGDVLPRDITLPLVPPAKHVKVKKTITLLAPNGDGLDRAAANVVTQRLVPEPASLVLLGLAGLLGWRRR